MTMTYKTIAGAFALAAAAVAFIPRPAEALPNNDVTRYYFSDPGFNNYVGEEWLTSCYGVMNQLTGSTGPYSYTVSERCH